MGSLYTSRMGKMTGSTSGASPISSSTSPAWILPFCAAGPPRCTWSTTTSPSSFCRKEMPHDTPLRLGMYFLSGAMYRGASLTGASNRGAGTCTLFWSTTDWSTKPRKMLQVYCSALTSASVRMQLVPSLPRRRCCQCLRSCCITFVPLTSITLSLTRITPSPTDCTAGPPGMTCATRTQLKGGWSCLKTTPMPALASLTPVLLLTIITPVRCLSPLCRSPRCTGSPLRLLWRILSVCVMGCLKTILPSIS
mmetsp:Transcript_38676/g.75575  ORF Transcript_38676/g.75575 Transcript_38676/m.75575 type:complete len:251 (-) Transcript_38676:379-1131(-)